MNLSTTGRSSLLQFMSEMANAYEQQPVEVEGGMHFAATPTEAQRIYDKIAEDGNAFLNSLNPFTYVKEIAGQKVGMSLSNRAASRTDTSGAGERVPRRLENLDAIGYQCHQTNFDVAIRYDLVDLWAKFPDFAARYMAHVRRAIGNDILTVGWHGTSVAATTNIVANPNLEDVNIGWLETMRQFNAGQQYLDGTGTVTLGAADFLNLDVLVHEAKQMLPIQHRNRDDLVCIVGGDILSSQEETYFETNGNKPTEKAMLTGRITKAYANTPTMYAPFFPDGGLILTPKSNLKVYVQEGSVRRTHKDKPSKDEVQDFNSANHDYVVEDEETAVFIENISIA